MKIAELHELIAEVCPIEAISSSGGITFKEEATPLQKEQAQQMLQNWINENEQN